MKRLLFIAVIIISSCSENEVLPTIQNPTLGIHISDLKPNQTSMYAGYQSKCGGGFEFTGDTLTVKTVLKNDTIHIEETLTSDPAPRTYQVLIYDDYLLIEERWSSRIFGFYGNDTLFLNKAPNARLVQKGCRLFIGENEFIGEQIGSVNKFVFGSIRIEEKKGVSCIPTLLRVDGYLIYDDYLNLSHRVTEEGDVSGFVAISENEL
ncbi:MAG: hypothetical protein JXR03_15645 [Cyclobacteriaceae bacterium]